MLIVVFFNKYRFDKVFTDKWKQIQDSHELLKKIYRNFNPIKN